MTTNQPIECDQVQSELAAYALGEGELVAAAQAHIDACPDCRQALKAYRAVAQILPLSAASAEPPPALRERLIAATQPATPSVRASIPPVQVPQRPQPRPRPSFGLRAAFACMLALIVGLFGWNIMLQNQVTTQAAQLAGSRETWQSLVGILNDPAVRWYAVSGETAQGRLWTNSQGEAACLMAEDLPALETTQTYQVWLKNSTGWVNAGQFEPRNGKSWFLLELDQSLVHYGSVLVTVEPSGGNTSPQGPVVLSGELS